MPEFRRVLFRSDRKSTRLKSSHTIISYAVFCLKKKYISRRVNRQFQVVEQKIDALQVFGVRNRTRRTFLANYRQLRFFFLKTGNPQTPTSFPERPHPA